MLLGTAWSVTLFNAASDRDIEPFKTIVFRARVTRYYADHAPEKLGEVPSILEKNRGKKMGELFSRLERKYGQSVGDLDVVSMVLATSSYTADVAGAALPQPAVDVLHRGWYGKKTTITVADFFYFCSVPPSFAFVLNALS